MFEAFECNCIYVEAKNPRVPKSGCVEYRAKQCDICRARDALARAGMKRIVAFDSQAPRYQQVH